MRHSIPLQDGHVPGGAVPVCRIGRESRRLTHTENVRIKQTDTKTRRPSSSPASASSSSSLVWTHHFARHKIGCKTLYGIFNLIKSCSLLGARRPAEYGPSCVVCDIIFFASTYSPLLRARALFAIITGWAVCGWWVRYECDCRARCVCVCPRVADICII